MRKIGSRSALVGVAVLLTVAFGAASRADAVSIPRQLTCNDTYAGGTYSSVLVRSGSDCTLEAGAEVTGNVVVKPGGALLLSGSTVDGNLGSNGNLEACNSEIGKNVFIGGSGEVALGIYPSCANEIGGNVQVQGTSLDDSIENDVISGSVHAFGNSGFLEIAENSVARNVSIESNSGEGFIGYFQIDAYDFQLVNNSAAFELANVSVSHNALCRNNPNIDLVNPVTAGNRNTCSP